MPNATINTIPQHFPLKTLEGAFVEIRRMPYGDWLHRSEMAMHLKVQTGGRKSRGQKQGMEGEMTFANQAVTKFEFSRCIVSHNLEHENGELMDFNNPATYAMLDPRVGNEIGTYISELHEFEQDMGNSESESSTA